MFCFLCFVIFCDSRSEFLRRLVMELITSKCIHKLCSYSWIGYIQEVEDILWWQARTAELLSGDQDMDQMAPIGLGQPNYYEILTAFLWQQHNYMSTARYMYHYVLRLERETDLSQTNNLNKQCSALMIVMNSLQLCGKSEFIMFQDTVEQPINNIEHSDKRARSEMLSPVSSNSTANDVARSIAPACNNNTIISCTSKVKKSVGREKVEDCSSERCVFNKSICAKHNK